MKTKFFLFGVLLALTGSFLDVKTAKANAPACGGMHYTKVSSFTTDKLNLETLQGLVGSKIEFTGKYNHKDLNDNRRISGKGTVLRVAHGSKDENPTFAILLRSDKGETGELRVFVDDTSFLLKQTKRSPLNSILERMQNSGLQYQPLMIHEDGLMFAFRLRKLNAGPLRIVYIDSNSTVLREFDAESMNIPTDSDMAMAMLLKDRSALFEFTGKTETLKIAVNNVVGIGIKAPSQNE
jgi:hypothetical protein